jgi:hypothetical protein
LKTDCKREDARLKPARRARRSRSIRSAMSITPRLGILAAMPPEIEKLKQHVENQEDHKHGSAFTFTTGTLGGRPVVFAAANVSCQAH